jgi:hypothetical protein
MVNPVLVVSLVFGFWCLCWTSSCTDDQSPPLVGPSANGRNMEGNNSTVDLGVDASEMSVADMPVASDMGRVIPPEWGALGSINVTVLDGSTGLPGASVVIHDPDGVAREVVVTDEMGRTSGLIYAGGLITFVFGAGVTAQPHTLSTVTGVQPGDALRLQVGPIGPPEGRVGIADVTLPGNVAGATRYRVDIGCSRKDAADLSQPISTEIFSTCPQSGDSFDALGVAMDPSGELVRYTLFPEVARGGGNTGITMPGWRDGWDTVDVTVEGQIAADWAELDLVAMRRGVGFIPNDARTVVQGGPNQVSFQLPTGFSEDTYLQVEAGPEPTRDGGASSRWAEQVASMGGTVDVTASLLPFVTEVELVQTGPRPGVAWQTGGGNASADVGILRIYWLDDLNRQLSWTVLFDPDEAVPFVFPQIPGEFFTGHPGADSTIVARVGLLERADIADYDAFRAELPVDKFDAEPGTGRVRFSTSVDPSL